MGSRILKESICTSDDINRLGWFEEVFFYRLLVNCDDYGVMDARPRILSSRLFPLKDEDEIGKEEIRSAIATLSRIGLIRAYTVDGKPYLQVTKWAEHQRVRISKHKYPLPEEADPESAPVDDPPQLAATCGEPPQEDDDPPQTAAERGLTRAREESESEYESESESVSEPARTRARGTDPAKKMLQAFREELFNRFWAEYLNKVKKPNARKIWDRLKPEEDEEFFNRIMTGLARWKQSDQWTRDGGRFIPHPATWLNGRQWEDEIQPRQTINAMSAHNFPERDYSNEDEEARQRMYEMIREEQAMMG